MKATNKNLVLVSLLVMIWSMMATAEDKVPSEQKSEIGVMNRKTGEKIILECHEMEEDKCQSFDVYVYDKNSSLGRRKLNTYPIFSNDLAKDKLKKWTNYHATNEVFIPAKHIMEMVLEMGDDQAEAIAIAVISIWGWGPPTLVVASAGVLVGISETLYSLVRLPILVLGFGDERGLHAIQKEKFVEISNKAFKDLVKHFEEKF